MFSSVPRGYDRGMRTRESPHIIPWVVAAVIGALLTLPLALAHTKHHYTTGAHIFAAVIFFAAFTAIMRLLIFGGERLTGRGRTPAAS